MEKEIWKDIFDYKNYMVSNYGRVKRIYKSKEKILKKSIDKYGYVNYCLRKSNKGNTIKIHRIVAKTFINNQNNFKQVNHKDENKQNNCVDNLEWCNNKYNSNYGTRGKRISQKLSIVLKKPILQIKDGNIIKKWNSALDVEKETKIKRSNICHCLKNKRKNAGGYEWVYENKY